VSLVATVWTQGVNEASDDTLQENWSLLSSKISFIGFFKKPSEEKLTYVGLSKGRQKLLIIHLGTSTGQPLADATLTIGKLQNY
jgi:hypothetical protein